jgi:thiol:disulfide interchange protein DsbC
MFKLLKGSRMAALLATVLLASGAAMAQATAGGQAAGASASAATMQAATAPAASAGSAADLETVRKRFGERFPGVKIDGVRHTPFPDVFEVQIGMDLLYTDGRVNYIMQGALIDAQTRRDLTAESLERLSHVAFTSLPLQHAVKQVKGDGSRQIAVFEDPNCGYCKQLHKTLKDVDNTTIYTFLYPILSPDSQVKARNIWCAKDQAATWRAWMLDGKVPPEATCDTPVDTIMALGRKLMVRGTPAIIFADGSRVNGALPLAALEKKLSSVN